MSRFATQPLGDVTDNVELLGLEIGPDGTPNAFSREIDRLWQSTLVDGVPVPKKIFSPTAVQHPIVTLDAAGDPVVAGLRWLEGGGRLMVRDAAGEGALGPTAVAFSTVRVAASPVVPGYVALAESDDGVHIVWPAASGEGDITLPDTTRPEFACDELAGTSYCDGIVCEDSTAGVEPAAHGLVHTHDGQLWAVLAVSHLEKTWWGECQGGKDGDGWCTVSESDAGSTTQLEIYRVSTENATAELAFSLEMPELSTRNLAGREGPLAVASHGTDLGTGVRIKDGPWADAIRILRVATSDL